ncbi:MAG TPA: thioredoxin domain-containing protein, partial [Ktedonobacterales bacterium]
PMSLAFLLRVLGRAGLAPGKEPAAGSLGARLLPLVRLTLDKMAAGGIYDQVGGGFHRYATDARWLVPHFEKMLYDNALLAPVYLAAWQLTGEPRARRVCEAVLDYVLREMTDPAGGFYSAQDADSEGEEGKFYVWSREELRAALAPEDIEIVECAWGVTEGGNFEGRTILHVAEPLEQVAAALGVSAEHVRAALARARTRLYEIRAHRVWPGRDDKVLAAWNGLMQRAFAEAGRVLDRADYREAARRNAAFLREHLVVDGRLQRSWRQGQARTAAYLEDYAALVNGLLSTYEATGEASHFAWARSLADELLARFWDAERETFYDTAHDAEKLIGRPRELSDGAMPAGMSLAAEALLRLWAFTGEDAYREVAGRVLLPLVPAMERQPLAFGHLLSALDDFVGPLHEVALVGAAENPATAALLATINGRYLPRLALARAQPGDATARAAVPLLEGRDLVDGHPAAYVCQDFVCQQPATDPAALARELR